MNGTKKIKINKSETNNVLAIIINKYNRMYETRFAHKSRRVKRKIVNVKFASNRHKTKAFFFKIVVQFFSLLFGFYFGTFLPNNFHFVHLVETILHCDCGIIHPAKAKSWKKYKTNEKHQKEQNTTATSTELNSEQ